MEFFYRRNEACPSSLLLHSNFLRKRHTTFQQNEVFCFHAQDQPWEPRPGALGQDASEAGFDVQARSPPPHTRTPPPCTRPLTHSPPCCQLFE